MRVAIVGGIFDRDLATYRRYVRAPETILAEGLPDHGIDVHTFGHRAFRGGEGFDVVHVHHPARGAFRMSFDDSGARFVFTMHSPLSFWNGAAPVKIRVLRQLLASRLDGAVAIFERELRVIGATMPDVKSRRIYNGVSSDIFQAHQRRPFDPGNVTLLYVGQLIPGKCVDDLLKAVALLSPRRRVRLRLAYHNAEMEAQLRALAGSLGIASSVEFVGMCDGPQLARLYAETDVLCLPSRIDALPSVVTEAHLCGCPVVAADVGGLRDQVTEADVLVPVNLPSLLADGIETVVKRWESGQIAPPALEERARRHFSITEMVAGHASFYREVAAGSARRRRANRLLGPAARAILNRVLEDA